MISFIFLIWCHFLISILDSTLLTYVIGLIRALKTSYGQLILHWCFQFLVLNFASKWAIIRLIRISILIFWFQFLFFASNWDLIVWFDLWFDPISTSIHNYHFSILKSKFLTICTVAYTYAFILIKLFLLNRTPTITSNVSPIANPFTSGKLIKAHLLKSISTPTPNSTFQSNQQSLSFNPNKPHNSHPKKPN